MIAGMALAEPNDQNSGTASHSRSSAVEMLPLADVEAVGQQWPVRQGHALGRGGGARGVEDEADVVRCDRGLRPRQRRGIDAAAARQEFRRAEGAG